MPDTIPKTYTIKLPQFEGPFDLLLFFIERDELDIYNIPIAKITDDFLAYLRQMERLNVDLASEFILVAATLCRIKARTILPRKQFDEAGNEIDPRQELVERLLEYKRYKNILDDMRELEKNRQQRSPRGNAADELKQLANQALAEVEMESVTLFKLLKTFERLIQRMEERQKEKAVHTVMRFNYSIKEQREHIVLLLSKNKKANFENVFKKIENRIHAIVTFLALLELINMQEVHITQGLGTNNFWISMV